MGQTGCCPFMAPNSRRNRKSTARVPENDLQRFAHVHVSDHTARDGLHEYDMRTQRPAVGPTPQCYHSCTCWHFDFPDILLTRVTL